MGDGRINYLLGARRPIAGETPISVFISTDQFRLAVNRADANPLPAFIFSGRSQERLHP